MSGSSGQSERVQPRRGPAPIRIVHAGRSLITRAELARLSGLSVSALAGLYAQRARTGHPPAVTTDPDRGTLYFDEEQVLRWHHTRRHTARTPPARALDVSGDPDELVTMTEAARILGYHSAATIRSYRARFDDYFPPPDHIDARGGRNRRLWRRSSVWAFGQRRGNRQHKSP